LISARARLFLPVLKDSSVRFVFASSSVRPGPYSVFTKQVLGFVLCVFLLSPKHLHRRGRMVGFSVCVLSARLLAPPSFRFSARFLSRAKALHGAAVCC
jgi:hypothetical protein